ncbi:hypothetical protein PoB_006256300 [Plakobranchus ocellatus]|uniref:Uncharacterized protein n=1 Tax=Plakobranchus ocellatus TaxID=259542 RepID=A0AAV4CVY0_9GAST|nr:hypothetical protein PoB_006256300 [Plakobranchus ocellatus]
MRKEEKGGALLWERRGKSIRKERKKEKKREIVKGEDKGRGKRKKGEEEVRGKFGRDMRKRRMEKKSGKGEESDGAINCPKWEKEKEAGGGIDCSVDTNVGKRERGGCEH